jgi:spore maturation protein CgeB
MHLPLERDLGRLRILYLGHEQPSSTSGDRVRALRRLGHEVMVINPDALALPGRIGASVSRRTGYRLTRRTVARAVTRSLSMVAFDLVWVNGGAAVGPALVWELRERSRYVLNYNLDDPFGGRDDRHWDTYLNAVPAYDLVVVVRECNVAEAYEAGARDVLRVWRTYDELGHRPRTLSPDESARWSTDVAFVGTWMPERGPFLADLLRRDVPLTVFGNGWMRAAERDLLAPVVRPPAEGEDYARAITAADVCLGLLSKGNRDLHTQRSLEIPALGGLLCAERTSEHASLYRDGVEAVLWSDSKECAVKCRELLDNPDLARSIATAGQRRVRQLGLGNEDMANAVLRHVGLIGADHPPG